jgi:hypothetical protein
MESKPVILIKGKLEAFCVTSLLSMKLKTFHKIQQNLISNLRAFVCTLGIMFYAHKLRQFCCVVSLFLELKIETLSGIC